MSNIQGVVQKILSDKQFRKDLAADPAATLTKAGVTPTADLIKTFKGVDEAGLQRLAQNYSMDKAAC